MPDLKPTTFATGPDDSVAVTDVYAKTDATPLNKVATTLESNAAIVVSSATKVFDITTLTEVVQDSLDGGRFDKATAMRELKAAAGGDLAKLGNITQFKEDMVTELLKGVGYSGDVSGVAKGLLGLPGGTDPARDLLDKNPKMKVVFNSVEHARKTADLGSARGVAELLNSVSGNGELAQVLDMQSQFAVLGTIMNRAAELQIPDIIDTVIAKFTTNDEKTAFLLQNAKQLADNGDVYGLSKLLEFATSHQVLAKVPDIVKRLLANYHLPYGVPKATGTELLVLTGVLGTLDSHWNQYNRNGTWINDLGVYDGISRDAASVLRLDLTHYKSVLMASDYPAQSFYSLAKAAYPYAAITA